MGNVLIHWKNSPTPEGEQLIEGCVRESAS